MSDNIDDYQFLELMNKNLRDELILFKDENEDLKDEVILLKDENKDLKDEVIFLKDENKDLKDQAAHLSAENKKLQDTNRELVDKVCDLADKYDELDRANQTRVMRESRKEEEVGERKRLADLANQSTVSRLPVLQQRAQTGTNTSRLLSGRKFGFQHQPAVQGCTVTATPSAPPPNNNNNVQLPPINTDEKTGLGGKAKKINSRFEEGVYHRGRKLVLPDIDNSTTGLIPKPPSALSDCRRAKPTQDVVTESSFTPRPPERKAKKSDFVFKRPGSKMAVPRGRRPQQQQDTASNSDSSRSTPVLVPRPPARQAKKGPFVFQRPNEKLAVPRSKPASAQKPVIIDRPAPASTEFVFNRVTSPVAAPRSVPNRST